MKRCLTIGVAGHVDHGKTTLVRSLTGIDTDRLREEKERGLSIESGIAPFILEEDVELAFVDVPGHSDYLKNTIRGLSCVDMALLVVGANDGIMPQTLEHIKLLELLGLKKGLMVLTKTDLVDQETLELGELELRDAVKGTFLENSSIHYFSEVTGEGKATLRNALKETALGLMPRDPNRPFRMWIDRLRVFSGFGTVVSGTIIQGKISEGSQVEILPLGERTKVRSLESHHRRIKEGYPGQRIGINLVRIAPSHITRGMQLVNPGAVGLCRYVNTEISNLSLPELELKDRQKVKVYIGTGCFIGEVVLFEGERLFPGEKTFAQIRLEQEVGIVPGDRFIITPMNLQRLLGGGSVIEVTQRKVKTSNRRAHSELIEAVRSGNFENFILEFLRQHRVIVKKQIAESFYLDKKAFSNAIERLILSGILTEIVPDKLIQTSFKEELKGTISVKIPESISLSIAFENAFLSK